MVYPGKKNAHHKLIAFLKIIKVKFWLSSMYYINCYHVGKIVFLFFLYSCCLRYWLEMVQMRCGVPAHHNRALKLAQHNKTKVLYLKESPHLQLEKTVMEGFTAGNCPSMCLSCSL